VEAQARSRLGQSLLDRDDLPAASRAFHEVIAVTRDMGDLVGEAYALQGLGTTQLRLGDYAQAGLLLGQAQRIAADNRERPLLAQVQLTRGELFLATGRSTDAARLLAEARDGFERLHAGPSSAIASELLSRCDQSQPG
jgi:tetratricopeptide (TPR) repeat protein